MSKTYSISELAKEFDITTRTIRFYEDKGMLSPSRKGQTRIYASADRAKLKLILRGKSLGMSLEESNELIGMYDPEGSNEKQLQLLAEKIKERKKRLKAQLKELEQMMSDLDEAEKRCVEWIDDLKNKQA